MHYRQAAISLCGDFNIYGSYESAYQKLLAAHAGTDGKFYDPLNLSGTWNDYSYRIYHTQSTRLNSPEWWLLWRHE